MNEPQLFLSLLFGSKPENHLVLLWELAAKRSHWFLDIGKAAEFAEAHNVNLYVGAGLSPKDYGPSQRCKAKDISGVVGLYADIDVLGPAHKTNALPPTIEEAQLVLPVEFEPSIIVNSGHGIQAWWLLKEPFIFDGEPHRERVQFLFRQWDRQLKNLAARHGWTTDSVFDTSRVLRMPGTINRKEGCPDVDARILKVKDVRYELSEIEAYVAEQAPATARVFGIRDRKPQITPGPTPDSLGGTMIDGTETPLMPPTTDTDTEEYRLWLRKSRADYLIGWTWEGIAEGKHAGRNDGGFALLVQLRDNGYSRSEAQLLGPRFVSLVDGIGGKPDRYTLKNYMDSLDSAYREARREPSPNSFWPDYLRDAEPEDHGQHEDPKPDQYADGGAELSAPEVPTSRDAMRVAPERTPDPPNGQVPTRDIEGANDDGGRPEKGAPMPALSIRASDAAQAKARALLKTNLKLDVVGVTKYGEGDGVYQLQLADGRKVDLGRTAQFATEKTFRHSIIAGLGVQVPPLKKKNDEETKRVSWPKVLDAMLTLLEVRPGFNDIEMLTEWVEMYLADRAVLEVPTLSEATPDVAFAFDAMNGKIDDRGYRNASLIETGGEGRVVIKLRSLFCYVTTHLNARVSQPDLSVLMGKAGFRNITTLSGPTWNGERLRVQRVWVAPASKFKHVPKSERVKLFDFDHPRYRPEEVQPKQSLQ